MAGSVSLLPGALLPIGSVTKLPFPSAETLQAKTELRHWLPPPHYAAHCTQPTVTPTPWWPCMVYEELWAPSHLQPSKSFHRSPSHGASLSCGTHLHSPPAQASCLPLILHSQSHAQVPNPKATTDPSAIVPWWKGLPCGDMPPVHLHVAMWAQKFCNHCQVILQIPLSYHPIKRSSK